MKDSNYIAYLENLALSAMAYRNSEEDIPKIDEPGITYSVYNARYCINRHRMAREGKADERGVVPDPPHTLTLIGGIGYFDVYLDLPMGEAIRRYRAEKDNDSSFKVSSFTFRESFGVYDAWPTEKKDK